MQLDQTPRNKAGALLWLLDNSHVVEPSVQLSNLGSELTDENITPENIYAQKNLEVLGRLRKLFTNNKFVNYLRKAMIENPDNIHPVIIAVFNEPGTHTTQLGIQIKDTTVRVLQ